MKKIYLLLAAMLCICVFAGTPLKFTPGGNKAVLMKDTTSLIATQAYAKAHGGGSATFEKNITGLIFDSLRFNHIQSNANDYTVASNIVIVSSYLPKTIGATYYVRFIGDGTHTPDFSNCVKVAGSPSYSLTLNAINDMFFWWNGHSIVYNIIQY